MEGGICTNTTEECDSNLFCRGDDVKLSTPVQHHYCSDITLYNTEVYEDIGRTDEEIASVTTSRLGTATAALIQCFQYNNHGV